ncbi:MAG: UBP-type zinc finger domain-containing protein [Herpetosiphon sp.]
MATTCEHENQIRNVTPSGEGCQECVELGDSWVSLRMCLTCGHVGCCDSSKNTHATRHFHATEHPVMQSYEPGQEWGWCYVDELTLEGNPLPHPNQHHR